MPDDQGYSPTYVANLVALIATDVQFLFTYHNILEGRFFDDAGTSWLVNKAVAHYRTYQTALSRSIIEQELVAEKAGEALQDAVLLRWDSLPESVDDTTYAYMIETAETYIRRQAILCAVMESQPLVEEGRQDEVIALVEEANAIRLVRSVGMILPEEIDPLLTRLNTRDRDVENIPTGVPTLDAFLSGGLRKKETAVLMAAKSKGKSQWLPYVAGSAVLLDQSVLCYTLEMSADDWAARLVSRMSGVPINDLSKELSGRKFKAAVRISESMKVLGFENATAVVKEIPPRKCTPETIATDIEELSAQGIHIDMVVIDYADLMTAGRYKEDKRYAELATIYTDITSLAKEYDVAIWTASQVNRQALRRKRISLDDVAISFDKLFPVDFVLGLLQVDDEEVPDENGHRSARIQVVAARRAGEFIVGNMVPVRLFYESATFKEIKDIADRDSESAMEPNVVYEVNTHLQQGDPEHSDRDDDAEP